jgi:Tol biopolymer transport system component
MTTEQRLERDLPSHLGDIAMGSYPEYIDDVLSITAQRRQRPGWTFPERWIPMDITTARVPATRLPWRQLGVLALLLILITGAVVVYVGSQQQTRLPAPFGLAANGKVLFTQGGDILVADPVTGDQTPIVTGPETDGHPVWSPDGTKIAFERKAMTGGPGHLFVARQDGQGLMQLTREPLLGLESWSFSPDGRSLTALVGSADPSILVIPTDGSGAARIFDVPATRDDSPPQYRPDGAEIMFIGAAPGADNRGVFALDPATGATRAIITVPESRDISSAIWSPDGSKISYNMHDRTAERVSNRVYVVSSDGSGAVAVDTDPHTIADLGGTWSNDGTQLVIGRVYEDDTTKTAIVPVDRSNAGVVLECPPGGLTGDCSADWTWSPDDTMLIGSRESKGPQFLADPQTGKIRPAPWKASGSPAWQRVAS